MSGVQQGKKMPGAIDILKIISEKLKKHVSHF